MRMRMGAPLVVALVSLLGVVQSAAASHCGAGNYDFKPVLDTLRRRQFAGWVSLESFDFTPGAERLANESLRHLESEIANLPS